MARCTLSVDRSCRQRWGGPIWSDRIGKELDIRRRTSFEAGGSGIGGHEQSIQRLRWLAALFDDQFRLPGTDRHFGLDGILGLIPALGDSVSAAMSVYLAAEGWRLGMPFSKIMRMGLNIVIDLVFGAVPLVGDLFDFAWKANQKNVRLVLDHVEE